LDLADRDIISHETLLERFREIPSIERVRVRREERERVSDTDAPKKAGPYHNPHHREDIAKIAMTKDVLDSNQYLEDLGLPASNIDPQTQVQIPKDKPSQPSQESGRPPFSRDLSPRKQRRVLPKSGEPTAATLWGIEAQEKIAEIMTPIACSHFGKKDARALSKSEVDDLEYLKLCIFTGLEPLVEVTPEIIQKVLRLNTKPSTAFDSLVVSKQEAFNTTRQRKPNIAEMRYIYASAYTEMFCNFNDN